MLLDVVIFMNICAGKATLFWWVDLQLHLGMYRKVKNALLKPV